MEMKPHKFGCIPKLGRNGASKPIVFEIQIRESRQCSNLSGQFSTQPIAVQMQSSYPIIFVCSDTPPFAQGLVAQPVLIVLPVITVRGLVECDQCLPIILRAGFRGGLWCRCLSGAGSGGWGGHWSGCRCGSVRGAGRGRRARCGSRRGRCRREPLGDDCCGESFRSGLNIRSRGGACRRSRRGGDLFNAHCGVRKGCLLLLR